MHNQVSCNVYPVVLLTREILKSFEKRYKKNPNVRSAVMNTGAMMSHGAVPFAHIYTSTKIFTDFVTMGLNYELSAINVDVSCFRPAGVATKLIGHDGSKAEKLGATYITPT